MKRIYGYIALSLVASVISSSYGMIADSKEIDYLEAFKSFADKEEEFYSTHADPCFKNKEYHLNRVATIAGNDKTQQLLMIQDAKSVRALYSQKSVALVNDYLMYIKNNGDDRQKQQFKDIPLKDMLLRLMINRPLSNWQNYNGIDQYRYKNGHKDDYIVGDEHILSALFGVGSSTTFINDGNRSNRMQTSTKEFEKRGIFC